MAVARRTRVFEHPGRVAIVTITIMATITLGAILLHNADTSPGGRPQLPADVESISPERGELTGLVDDVTIDLNDKLQGDMAIDGVQIPDDQLDTIPGLGVISFRPGPGKELTQFRQGYNTVVVHYWPLGKPRPTNPTTYSWTFRAAA
ncbi:MAG TPA: hypothetical protein VEP49_09050 [Acidimicrobiia bacterium]|nr:hypothetical protein [Acidimicrobiia bacterium]